MGYRSDVALAIPASALEEFISQAKENLSGGELEFVLEVANDLKPSDEFKDYLTTIEEYLKWRDAYHEVRFIEKFLEKHEGIIIRIGEEFGDIEIKCYSEEYSAADLFNFGTYLQRI